MKNVRKLKKLLIYLGITTSILLLASGKLNSKSTIPSHSPILETTKTLIITNPDIRLIKLLEEEGFTGEQNRVAWAIVKRESNGIHNARNYNRNKTWDRGLFQINDVHLKIYNIKSPTQLFNPVQNVKIAYKISNGGTNFSAWALPNLDGSITGYAKYLKEKSPSTYRKYYIKYKYYYNKYPL